EPPAAGPGPVRNKSRRPQVNFDGRVLPAVNDVLVSNPAQLVGDYTNPILKPHAAEAVKEKGEMELSGVVGPTPTIQCWPEPVPYIFNGVAPADAAAVGQDRFPLSERPSGPLRPHERGSSGTDNTLLVWGFRRPL